MYRLRIATELERKWRSVLDHELALTLPTAEGFTTIVAFNHAQTLDLNHRAYRCTVVETIDAYVVRAVRNAAYDHLRRRKSANRFAIVWR